MKEVSENTSEIDPIWEINGLYIIFNNVIYRLFIINNNSISLKEKGHAKLTADPR